MSPPKAAAAQFEAALSAHQAGRLCDAERGYLQVLSLDGRHASATHLLGVVHLQRGNLAAAEQMICKALALKEDAFFLGNLGTVLRETGRPREAEAAYQRAVAIKPDYADAHHNLGVLFRDSKRLPEAEAAFRRVLAIQPGSADAHYHLGNLLKETHRLAEAEAAYRSALAVRPDDASIHNTLGILLKNSGRLPEAETSYRRAVEINPTFANAHNNLGNLLQHNTWPAEAEAAYRRALEIKPDFASAHNNLGNLLRKCSRLPEAEAAYRRALEIEPGYVEAHYNLGILLDEGQRQPEAEAAYRRALAIRPDFADGYNNLGVLLKESGRLPEAEAACRRAVAIRPDFSDAHYNLGNVLMDGKRLSEAEAAYRRALEINPEFANAHKNLGTVLQDYKRPAEAEAAYRRAIAIEPDDADAHYNLGVLLKESRRLSEAEAAYRHALALKPGHAEARFNLSLLLLGMSRFDEAWPLYESRYAPEKKDPAARVPTLGWPQWQGESLARKSLVIWPEQGFGDYIQFVRYAPLLKARGLSRLTLVCASPLVPLLETVEGVDAVMTDRAQIPPHDYWSFILSLPLHAATTAQAAPPVPSAYMNALPARVTHWQTRLPATGRKVGLVWKGSPVHKNDGNRSLPGLASLAPLWAVHGINFISLQKGQGEDEASHPPAGQPLVALGAQMQDFADAAAIVSQLDLVICVDTAIAHLAGALGKPCWVLLPSKGTDWRWLHEGTECLWYPATRLFRQSVPENWGATINELAGALRAWTSASA